MRAMRFVGAISIVVLVLASVPTQAGDDLIIPLKFIPTAKPGSVTATLREGISNKPVAVAFEDVRQVATKDLIGEGTGSKDDTFRIRYAGFLPGYLKTTVKDRFGAWGIQTDDTSNLVLTMKVTRFHIRETHAFYGSQFNAEVQLPWTLADRAGHVFASGTAMGAGKTKGRWRNPVNCEEVLSDALQEAAANVAGDAKLQDAWLAANPEPARAPIAVATSAATPTKARANRKPGSAAPKTPAQLLAEVTKLRHQQFGTSLLVDYVSKQTIASAFSTNDLVQWKKAGVPEQVTAAALERAP